MATARKISENALRRLGILSAEQAISGRDADYCVEALNKMMRGLKTKKSLDLNWPVLGVQDDFPLDLEFQEGVEAMLAVRVANDYEEVESVSSLLVTEAQEGLRALETEFWIFDDMQLDMALQRMPSQRRRGVL